MGVRRALYWGGAAIALCLGAVVSWTVANAVREFYPFFMPLLSPDAGGGGLGAVSAGASDNGVLIALGLVPAIVINRRLATRARRERGRFGSLHRVHSILLLVFASGVGLLVLGLFLGAFLSLFLVLFLTLMAVGLQFFVLAALLGSLAGQPELPN